MDTRVRAKSPKSPGRQLRGCPIFSICDLWVLHSRENTADWSLIPSFNDKCSEFIVIQQAKIRCRASVGTSLPGRV